MDFKSNHNNSSLINAPESQRGTELKRKGYQICRNLIQNAFGIVCVQFEENRRRMSLFGEDSAVSQYATIFLEMIFCSSSVRCLIRNISHIFRDTNS
jgi:hypothetical protein